ncbi:protein KINESIN LIGHT CHAIN-RELATED 2-like [Rutidosis leptorrhynchoides]|uniref:protein KINESIN LIGHT CHAIN-RELATED 2-like n=1 Tax=Rutidosis leptorrhynchoides TaxID=125765 RepID=UPI003A9962B6
MSEIEAEKPNSAKDSETAANQSNVSDKDHLTHISPRSPFSTHTTENDSIDLSVNSRNSMDRLYKNVCEMESSDQSPSRFSYLSYGQESRIDSELRYLAGGGFAKDETEESRDGIKKDKNVSSDEKADSDVTTRKNKKTRQLSPAKSSGTIPKPSPNKKSGLKKPGKNINKNDDPKYLGTYLLKQARELVSAGDDPNKALEMAIRAMKSFESCQAEKRSDLEYVLCLHIVAALYCVLRKYDEATPIVERSIEITNIKEGQKHALAKFAGCMQLGDTYAMQGNIEKSILCYTAGLEIQKHALGEHDARFGETCRYVAEAHVQVLQFDEAKKLCKKAIDIHGKNGTSNSLQEAADRRLMGLICDSKGDYETAIDHYVLARMAMSAHGHDADVAAIDVCIGDAYLSLARYDEAIFNYQKALNVFRFTKGENHPSVASVYVRLADLYNKIGKFRESETYCEHAHCIYVKPVSGSQSDEIANGLVEVSAIYESMSDLGQALDLLKKARKAYGSGPGQLTTVAGVEAQIGVLCYMMGSYADSYEFFKIAISKFRVAGEKKSGVFGIALNQMGLACVQNEWYEEAAEVFEEARSVLETEYGPHHPSTLAVYSNQVALGRWDEAIEILEYVVEMREEKLGTANPEVDNEKKWLAELLRESGRDRTHGSRSLEFLLDG